MNTQYKKGVLELCVLALFAVCFVLTFLAFVLTAGGFEFWHIWHWF